MEPLKDLKLDVNRIILELFIPGIFSVLPFFILFINKVPSANKYFSNSEGMATLTLFILSIAAGLILEDIGSNIELYFWDRINLKKYSNHKIEWEQYLELNIAKNSNLIAQRYLRTILLRMKFELSFGFSLLIMSIGLLLLQNETRFCDINFTFIFCSLIFPVVLSIFLFWESWSSSALLINTRRKIINTKVEESDTNPNHTNPAH
jgi:hypothetical protein